jgi:hypothetical protein
MACIDCPIVCISDCALAKAAVKAKVISDLKQTEQVVKNSLVVFQNA